MGEMCNISSSFQVLYCRDHQWHKNSQPTDSTVNSLIQVGKCTHDKVIFKNSNAGTLLCLTHVTFSNLEAEKSGCL